MLDEDTRIMIIGTTCLEVPPEEYGGLELMVYNLAHELGQRGHSVACAAPQGTEIENVNIIETTEPDNSKECFAKEPDAYEIYAELLPSADIIIDHSWQKMSYLAKVKNPQMMANTPILGVWHGMPSKDKSIPVDKPCYASVSKAASRSWERHTGYEVRHVYNGIDFGRYNLNRDKDDYYMTLNRIMPQKGIDECVHLANETGVEMVIAGEDTFIEQVEFSHHIMRACADNENTKYCGTVPEQQKQELLSNAKCLVLLPQPPYEEVFGLAAVEAFACGTPVIAMKNSGLGEVVETVQGWGTVTNLHEAKQRVEQLENGEVDGIEPEKLRSEAQEYFSKEAMTDIYLERCEEALQQPW